MLSPSPDQLPHTLAPLPCSSARPPTLSPIFLLSIPLLSRQAARMAGMETFTDGNTGKFPTSTNTLTRHFVLNGGGGIILQALLRVRFHVCSPRLQFTLPPLFCSEITHLLHVSSKKKRKIAAHFSTGGPFPPGECPGERRWRGAANIRPNDFFFLAVMVLFFFID